MKFISLYNGLSDSEKMQLRWKLGRAKGIDKNIFPEAMVVDYVRFYQKD
jgi:hypothetical protein